MNISVLRDNRRIIPRWRSLDETFGSGVLSCFGHSRKYKHDSKEETEHLLNLWNNNNSLENANELFQHSIMLSDTSIASDAIAYLDKNSDKLPIHLRDVVANYLNGNMEQNTLLHPAPHTLDTIYTKIHTLKKKLHINPKQVFNWVELARMYTTINEKVKAFNAIRIAYNLYPRNRYILRSLIRFCVHFNEFDYLAKVFRNIVTLYNDPWLLAPFISLKDNLNRTNLNIKKTRSLINSSNKINKTELMSSLASLELKHGAVNNSKKLFKSSLSTPNDNSLSQAIWASSFLKADLGVNEIHTNFMYEPLTRTMIKNCNFIEAFNHSKDWINDEPFSSVPSITASYIACAFLNDPVAAKTICKNGLISNPNDSMLKNNYVYSLLASGETSRAREEFSTINKAKNESNVTYIATYGFLLIKEHNIVAGRKKYNEAINLSKKNNNKFYEELANLHLLKSELEIGEFSQEELFEQLKNHEYQKQQPEIIHLRQNIYEQISNYIPKTK